MYNNGEDNSWSFAAGLFVGALIGAGLARLFTPRSGPQNRDMVREKSVVLKERVSGVTATASTRVSDAASTVAGRASAVASTVGDKASSAANTVQEAASNAASKVSAVAATTTEKVSAVASTATEKVSDVASTATEKVSTVASTAATKVSGVASTATEKARELTGRGSESAGTGAETVTAGYQVPATVEQTAERMGDIPVAPAAPAVSQMEVMGTTSIVGDLEITDSSVRATRELASDEQYEVHPPASGSSPIVSSNISTSGEVPGASGSSNV